MIRRFAAAAAFAATVLASAADDPNAPLANTKAQLQSLKKDEAAQKADTQGGAKFDLPSLNTPGQELELPRPKRDDAAKENKRAGQKDWLLDGFDKLDRKKSLATGSKRADARSEEDEKPLDPNDPDYFLRVYERQRAERDAKQLELNAPNATELKTDSADAFAPFMKEWLANSPVRDALQDASGRGGANDYAHPQSGDAGQSQPARGADPFSTVPARAAPTANPFVQALGLPTTEQTKPTEFRAPVADVLPNPAPARSAAASTIYDLPERPKNDVKQAVPPPPSDDKKYFPQLKKF